MGVHIHNGTMPGALTPVCNMCGVSLCWDIGEQQYHEEKQFWDEWVCRDCNGGEPMSLRQFREQNNLLTLPQISNTITVHKQT